MVAENNNDVVLINDASKSASFFKLKLIDQGVYNKLRRKVPS